MQDDKGKGSTYSEDPRINSLIGGMVTQLRQFIEEQARQISDLVDIGTALSAERDLKRVLELILTQARRFTNADGGTLYLVTDDERELAFHVLHNETLNSFQGGTSGNEVTLPNVPLYDDEDNPNHANVSAHVALSGELVNIPDVYVAEGFNFEGTKKFDSSLKYRSQSMLVVPMRDHEGEIIGVLQLINAKNSEGDTIAFPQEQEGMIHALASQAAVALTQQRLIFDLKNLFESFIKAIATAIDEKSKYTGGHISRVTELTMLMANKINEWEEGPYADVTLNIDELEELRIAAWMHDTGKITTPEYVVDKSNKLETVFDRIDLVQARFQAIELERKVRAYEALLEDLGDEIDPRRIEEIRQAADSDIEALQDDLEFLVTTNKGGEFLADEKIERLERIASRKWTANDESERPYLTDDELYNLSIRKGTLTTEERDIMNNHATMSIKILNELPWPKKLRNVPPIAGAHHEKLDGTGYPNGLKGDEIGLQARIMAVADVFEALSAKDRPYKDPMPLSQAIKILGFMVKDKHLDGDVVQMFIESGIVFDYAKKYLDKKQIDITADDLKQSEKK